MPEAETKVSGVFLDLAPVILRDLLQKQMTHSRYNVSTLNQVYSNIFIKR